MWALVVGHRFSSCSTWPEVPLGTWDPGPLHWELQVLPLDTREVPHDAFRLKKCGLFTPFPLNPANTSPPRWGLWGFRQQGVDLHL